MKIGRKIYYDKLTGEVIVDTGERQMAVIPTTVEQDIDTYTALTKRNRDSFDVIDLSFGAYSRDFVECNGYRVNVETKTIEFNYPDPTNPNAEITYVPSLSEELSKVKQELAETNASLLEILEMVVL